MSFDPYGADVPDPYAGPPPPENVAVRERVQMPAILLMVVGVLNLLFALYILVNGVSARRMTVEDMRKMYTQRNPDFPRQEAQLEKAGYPLARIKDIGEYSAYAIAGAGFLGSLLTILGGRRMYQLRSYGLAVLGSIVAALPILSGTACCCLGEGVGLWALIVLLNGQVRSAFR